MRRRRQMLCSLLLLNRLMLNLHHRPMIRQHRQRPIRRRHRRQP
jgi:hypothetical protein